jgi:amino acid transporter
MQKIAITYGILSGTITIVTLILALVVSDGGSFLSSELFGYLTMLVALSMIFIGIKRYRDQELGGVIRFLPAFAMGLAIAVIAGIVYTLVWELYSVSTDYAFIDSYVNGAIETKRAAGLTGDRLLREIAELEELRTDYGKFYIRMPMTFLEIFPVGLAIALLSAALLRNPKILPARQ